MIGLYQDRAHELAQLEGQAKIVNQPNASADNENRFDIENPKKVTQPFAMIDALGFSNALKTEGLDAVGNKHKYMVINTEMVASLPNLPPTFRTLSASDTVFLYFRDDNSSAKGNLKALIEYVAVILANTFCFLSFRQEGDSTVPSTFPIRGAITFGEYAVGDYQFTFSNREPTNMPFAFGRPVVNAQEWERQQKWIGVSISPASTERIDSECPGLLTSLSKENFLVRWDVPTVHGPIEAWAVNPLYYREGKDIPSLMSSALLHAEEYATELSVKAKYLATRRFLEHVTEHGVYNPT